jgi:hypothetical protein
MASCDNCATPTTDDARPDPQVDRCSKCDGPICTHCCADDHRAPPYRHAKAYCSISTGMLPSRNRRHGNL